MTRKLIYEALEKLQRGEIMKPDVMDVVDAYLEALLKQCNVSGALPPDFEIHIYPSYDKGKWAARCRGVIRECFDTPQDALNWGMSKAAMTA